MLYPINSRYDNLYTLSTVMQTRDEVEGITVSNSSNPWSVYTRLCKHGKRFLLFKWY